MAASAAAAFRVVMAATAAATAAGSAAPRFSAVATTPVPTGLVSTRWSPGRARSTVSSRAGSAIPTTAMPYLGSGSSIEWPPTTRQPASAATSAPPRRTSASRSTAASSPSAAPTSRSPLAPPSPWPTVDISSSSAPSGSLQAQPAPWESEVRRIVPVSVMRCSVVGAGWSGGCRERLGCRGPPRRRSPWRAATFRIGLPPFQAVAVTSRAVEESVFAAILQDAWRQYRRRPLAVVLTVGLGVVQALLTLAGETVQLVIAVPLLVVSLMLELFLIAYLAGALGSGSPAAAASLATARRSFGPGVRAFLLKGVYALPAFLIGILLLGPGDTGPLPASEQAKFFV